MGRLRANGSQGCRSSCRSENLVLKGSTKLNEDAKYHELTEVCCYHKGMKNCLPKTSHCSPKKNYGKRNFESGIYNAHNPWRVHTIFQTFFQTKLSKQLTHGNTASSSTRSQR